MKTRRKNYIRSGRDSRLFRTALLLVLILMLTPLSSTLAQAAPVNLALSKTATQSSTYTGHIGGSADRAVDGNTDGNYFNGSVTHTNLEQGAWWQVDLGAVYSVRSIEIYNRTDAVPERLSNFYVRVSEDGVTWSSSFFSGPASEVLSTQPSGALTPVPQITYNPPPPVAAAATRCILLRSVAFCFF